MSILEGDPGGGKSYIGAAIAAGLSLGVGLPGQESRDPCSSLLLALEDGAPETLRPRIEGMGADLGRIHVVDCTMAAGLTLDQKGADWIEEKIESTRARFVFIDPVTALLSARIDLNRDNQVRESLNRLVQIAATQDCSICIVRHLNKGGGSTKAIYRGSGSIGIAAIARTVMLVGSTPDGSRSGIVLHKSNIGPKAAAVEFEIDSEGRFAWKPGESNLTAEELLGEPSPYSAVESSRLGEAVDFLRETLAEGEKLETEIEAEVKALGISKSTLKRAKRPAGVRSFRRSTGWVWALAPTTESKLPSDA